MRVRPFTEDDTERVIRLWNDCGLTRPWNDPRKDIVRKLTVQPDLQYVVFPNTTNAVPNAWAFQVRFGAMF